MNHHEVKNKVPNRSFRINDTTIRTIMAIKKPLSLDLNMRPNIKSKNIRGKIPSEKRSIKGKLKFMGFIIEILQPNKLNRNNTPTIKTTNVKIFLSRCEYFFPVLENCSFTFSNSSLMDFSMLLMVIFSPLICIF